MKLYCQVKNELNSNIIKEKINRKFYSYNMFHYLFPKYQGNVIVVDSKKLNLKLNADNKGHIYYESTDSLEKSIIDIIPYTSSEGKYFLMNTSRIDEKWCYPVFKKNLNSEDVVCVFAMSFFDDTKNKDDWNKQYSKEKGIFYKENTDVFFRYGIKEENIHWVNYFVHSKIEIENMILNSTVLLFTGGAPDLMMNRIKELKLKKILKNYQGVMIGYSAGAMIQLDEYHITPDRDYPVFKYLTGLGCLSHFKIEVHFRKSNIQLRCIEKVLKEKKLPVYGIYEDGGLYVYRNKISMFGHVDVYDIN